MKILDELARGLLRPINPYASVVLGFFTSFWGLWLLMPFITFGTSNVYSKMDGLAPEWAWGAWALTSGIMTVVAILTKHKDWLRRTHAFSTWHWGTVSMFMWLSDWTNTGGMTYSFIALYSAYCYLNVRANSIDFSHDD